MPTENSDAANILWFLTHSVDANTKVVPNRIEMRAKKLGCPWCLSGAAVAFGRQAECCHCTRVVLARAKLFSCRDIPHRNSPIPGRRKQQQPWRPFGQPLHN